MQVYAVVKESKGTEGRQVWIFTIHADALRCRQENKLDSHHLFGCVVDCYEFRSQPTRYVDLEYIERVNRMKAEKLTDLMRRVMANPGNLSEVVREIAADWFPMCLVDEKGEVSF